MVACPPVYLVGHFLSFQHVQGSTPTGVFEGGCGPSTHFSLGFPFHFSLFVVISLNLWRWWHVWSDFHLLRQSSGGHGWLLPPPLSSWRLRPYRLRCLQGWGWWSHLAWKWDPTRLVFGDWAISVHFEVLRFAVFFNEKLDLWVCFSLLAILDSAFPSFLAGVSQRDAGIGLGTFSTTLSPFKNKLMIFEITNTVLHPINL